MNKEWVIEVYQDRFNSLSTGYYTGYTYIHQGEYYGVFDDIDAAKVYTSQKRAVNAMEKLKLKILNWESDVEPVKEEEPTC